VDVPFWQVLRFFDTTAIVGNTAIIKHAETPLRHWYAEESELDVGL
jgi:hypothetical protein